MSKTVAQTISNQINTLDPLAFFAWGAKDLKGFSGNELNLGALRWTSRNCRSFKGNAYVKVTLEFNDTYTVKLYQHKNFTKKMRESVLKDENFDPTTLENVIDERKDVHIEELIRVVDDMLGEVR